jgi:hypothetical protein
MRHFPTRSRYTGLDLSRDTYAPARRVHQKTRKVRGR